MIESIVYIDMLFLVNMLMNSLTIYIASFLLTKEGSIWRMSLAAGILSVYSCIVFFPKLSFLYSIIGKIAVLLASCMIMFPSRNFRVILKNMICYFTTSAVCGGIIFALIFATDFGTTVGAAVSNGEVYLNISPSALVVAVIISYICAYITFYIKKQAEKLSKRLFNLKIVRDKNELNIKALGDTGCSLCDESGSSPAIIISGKSAKKICSKADEDFKALPYKTLSGCGCLKVFTPDEVYIDNEKIRKCIIAVSDGCLCENEEFDAIFNPFILNDKE